MAALSPASKAALTRLRAFVPPPTQYFGLPLARRAAVLILLFADVRGELRVVLTIRSAKLRNYAGQAALPGGKADTLAETPFMTARREAFEEIGLPMTDDKLPPGYTVEHLTELPTNLAMTELGVRPCVAWLRHRRQTLDQDTDTQTPSSNRSSPTDTDSQTTDTETTETPDPSRDLLPQMDAKEVAAMFTAPFSNFLSILDDSERDRREVQGSWYQGSWMRWHEEAWRMHQFFVPTVRKGSVFRSKDTENTDLRAATAACSPRAKTPTLLADEEVARQKKEKKEGMRERGDVSPSVSKVETRGGGDGGDALDMPRYRVFGMTARILVDAARVAYGREPEFEHNSHFGDEDMIARLMRIGRMGTEKRSGEVLTRDVMMKAKREGGSKLS